MATIKIHDDFDMEKIANSGQCFRARELGKDYFRFITRKHALYIRKVDNEIYDVSCSQAEWDDTWTTYFDLETNYSDIRQKIEHFANRTKFADYLNAATNFGKGIRILRQDPFETLISFIISQRKTIPAIKKSVELICEQFGEILHSEREENLHTFPTHDQLAKASQLKLSACALGYRGSYIHDAIQKVHERIVRLDDIAHSTDEDLLTEVQNIKGVGPKIANCVALYAYHRLNLAPVDVWIKRSIQEDFHGENIFAEFGSNAGVLQQYIFYYKRLAEKEFDLQD